jgi:hypothetical protein
LRHFSVHINFWGKVASGRFPAFRALGPGPAAIILNGNR